MKTFTDEQYIDEYARIKQEKRYAPEVVEWALSQIANLYRERNGNEPPQIKEVKAANGTIVYNLVEGVTE